MKSVLRRLTALMVCVVIVFSLVGDLSLAIPLYASSVSSDAMHIIINHWHAYTDEGKSENVVFDAYLSSDGNLYGSDGKQIQPYSDDIISDIISGKILTVKPHPYAENEKFSGFTVSAGNEAVTINDSTETADATVEIEYTSGIRLVKVGMFYSGKEERVGGANFGEEFGSSDVYASDVCYVEANGDPLQPIDNGGDVFSKKYNVVDPKYVVFDAKGNISLSDDYKIKNPESKADGVVKLYNTNAGLHTDKTVYATDVDREGLIDKDGSREFDVKLESWYAGNAIADIGLILDASGSMAFLSDGLTPIKISDFGDNLPNEVHLESYNIDDGTYTIKSTSEFASGEKTVTIKANEYIPQSVVDMILDKTKTDNSPLGYSGYSYYIYDRRNSTREFVPIGYWSGEHKTIEEKSITYELPTDKLIGQWKFENNLKNSAESGGEAKFVKKPESNGAYTEELGKSPSNSDVFVSDKLNGSKALNLSQYAQKNSSAGILLDAKPTSNSFTLSFGIKKGATRENKNTDNTLDHAAMLFHIGNINEADRDSGYNIYFPGGSSSNHFRLSDSTDNSGNGKTSQAFRICLAKLITATMPITTWLHMCLKMVQLQHI